MCLLWEKYTCIYLGSSVPNCFTILAPFLLIFLICGIPKNFECFSTTYRVRSKWKFLKHRGTLILWRCSLLLFFFYFFFLFSHYTQQLVGPELEPFHHGEFLVSVLSVVTDNSPEKAIRWCGFGAFCFLSFCLVLWVGISGVQGQWCLLVLVKTNLQTPCLSTSVTVQASRLVLCLTPARWYWLSLFPELGFSKVIKVNNVP